MLNLEESTEIVIDCIQAISNVDDIDSTKPLSDARITDTTRLNNFLTLVINDSEIGVPSKGHRINQGWFNNVSTDTIVDDVIDIVEMRSTQIQPDFIENFASLVADHVNLHSEVVSLKKKEKEAKKEKKAGKKTKEDV